jgi:Na+/pantothenate symporter
MGGFVLAWQWIASLGLSVVFLRGATAWALSGWKWPFLATFATPVLVFAMILVDVRGRQHGAQV